MRVSVSVLVSSTVIKCLLGTVIKTYRPMKYVGLFSLAAVFDVYDIVLPCK